jgi:hypothetical protein
VLSTTNDLISLTKSESQPSPMARTRQVGDSRADAAEPTGGSDGWGRRTDGEGNCVGRGDDVRLGGGESRL